MDYMSFERKGYKHTDLGDGGRFKGIYVHIYNNKIGKYGFVHLETSHDPRKLDRLDSELMEYLFYLSVDEFIKIEDSTEYKVYKYSIDFVNGFRTALKMV